MHHNDAPNLDPRTDITDLYLFQMPDDPTKSILIMNVHPEAPTPASGFDPNASYEFEIDSNADFEAEIRFHISFTDAGQGRQTATVRRAVGAAAQATGPVGDVIVRDAPVSLTDRATLTSAAPYRFYAGLRSDPFFADPVGFLNGFHWTGQDFWEGKNVLGIVLEVPNTALGSQPRIGVWARTMAFTQDSPAPINQMGRPGHNVLRQGADTNSTPPSQQRDRFLSQYVATFESFGYSKREAMTLALEWLPDVLAYDYTSAAGYPNGRQLRDDILDSLVAIMTRGKMKGDLLGPHSDYLPEFPFLATPHGGPTTR